MRKMIVVLSGVALLEACSDSSAPTQASVAGLYEFSVDLGPATCTPASAGPILESVVALSPVTLTGRLRIERAGDQLTVNVVEVLGAPASVGPITGAMDAAGNFALTWPTADREMTILYSGAPDRTFWDHFEAQSNGGFDLQATPLKATGTTTAVEVFREGTLTAPVFATCTTPEADSWTRVGS
jgi:hypothetical protein